MLQEQHEVLLESLDDLVRREIQPNAAETDRQGVFPSAAMSALAKAGHLGSVLPEPYGAGADLLSFALTVERIAAASPSVAWAVVVHVSATMGIANAGTDEQKTRLLPALAAGDQLASFAFTEAGAGADFSAVECLARISGDAQEYSVQGSKTFISLASCADVFVTLTVAERDGQPAGPTMLLIERSASGFETGSRFRGSGMRGIGWGEILFVNCPVPTRNLLGEEGKGTRIVSAMAGPYLLGAAALGVGIGAGAYEAVRAHLAERKVKGAAIGGHEALQFRMADLSARLEAARALLYRACVEKDPRSFLPFSAKLFATETALDITRAAMQLGGATAYAEGSAIERLARDAHAVPLHFENNDFLRAFMGRMLLQG